MSQHHYFKWSNHRNDIMEHFKNFFEAQSMVDVTLACDGKSLKAHKIVLSACSTFLKNLLEKCDSKHPIITIAGVDYTALKAIIEFMYHGEVSVPEELLSSLKRAAETLKVNQMLEMFPDELLQQEMNFARQNAEVRLNGEESVQQESVQQESVQQESVQQESVQQESVQQLPQQDLTDDNMQMEQDELYFFKTVQWEEISPEEQQGMNQKILEAYATDIYVFQEALQNINSVEFPYYTLKALTPMISSPEIEESTVKPQIVNIMEGLQFLASNSQEKAADCLKILLVFIESEIATRSDREKALKCSLELAEKDTYDKLLRLEAISVAQTLIGLIPGTVIEKKLTKPILDVCLLLMGCTCPGENYDEERGSENTMHFAARKVIEAMAEHLPLHDFIPNLMYYVKHARGNDSIHHRHAFFFAISIIVETCSKYFRHNKLKCLVEVTCQEIKYQNRTVCDSAVDAVGQYAEYLQPEIGKYAPELLRVLFGYLEQGCLLLQQGSYNYLKVTRAFDAIEKLFKYLEDVKSDIQFQMNLLDTFVNMNPEKCTIAIKVLALKTIGAIAAASKELFAVYFPNVVMQLKIFIFEKPVDPAKPLLIQSIDTLSIIARNVGKEVFLPLAHEYINRGIDLMKENDPDIRCACYGLFSSVATVLKQEMAPYLEPIVEHMLLSIKSVTQHSENILPQEEEATETDKMDIDIPGDVEQNSSMEETEEACLALKEICEEVGLDFIPLIRSTSHELEKLIENTKVPDEVRQAAIAASAEFCFALHKAHSHTEKNVYKTDFEFHLNALIRKVISLIREDTKYQVVATCFDTIKSVVKELPQNLLNLLNFETVCEIYKDVFRKQLPCQSDDDQDIDSMLIVCAGELIACLNEVMPEPVQHLRCLIEFLTSRTEREYPALKRLFAIRTLADIVSSMKSSTLVPNISEVEHVFLISMNDETEEIRGNACYGLGILVEVAGEQLFHEYPNYFKNILPMICKEKDEKTKDNICGTIARLIKKNLNFDHLKEAFQALLNALPIREELEEETVVHSCFAYLYSIKHEMFFENFPKILMFMYESLACHTLNEDTAALIRRQIKDIAANYPQIFRKALKVGSKEQEEYLKKVIHFN